ncbi:MAG: 5-formyltetrahydrofolate cyclo-ligase [Clostridia bacterium]|jgi:5-formyltetrahydrofolate cyclo-ligase|nr:5-formyltetrahydrofolate cyclo-ligase [Clostridia bacterium]
MKDDIRREMRNLRAHFTGINRAEADKKLTENFLKTFCGYQSYFVYNSFGTEADTSLIIKRLLSLGKRVYLPRVEGEKVVAAPFGETKFGAFGIAEPTGQAFFGDIEITVIPLLAVNACGYRIGYGKGYYDRYFKCTKTVKVGLAYGFQIADFKEDVWDEPLNYLVTESGVVKYEDNKR